MKKSTDCYKHFGKYIKVCFKKCWLILKLEFNFVKLLLMQGITVLKQERTRFIIATTLKVCYTKGREVYKDSLENANQTFYVFISINKMYLACDLGIVNNL